MKFSRSFSALGLVPLLASAAPAPEAIPDPAEDGWLSEAFAERVGGSLDAIKGTLLGGEPAFGAALADDLRPDLLEVSEIDDSLSVGRWDGAQQGAPARLSGALEDISRAFEGDAPEHVKFKLFGVDGRSTDQYFAASGTSASGGFLEINATWRIRWAEKHPLPESVSLLAYEEVRRKVPAGSPMTVFVDATGAVIPPDPGVRSQFGHGTDHWRQRIELSNRMFKFAYNGIAVGDADGDGLDDLFVCQNGGLPNRLFLQNPDGTLRDATEHSGLGMLDSTQAALLVDLDNDGDQDLVATTPSALVIFENTGGGKFVPRLRSRVAENGYGLAAADFDQDGFLDIYVCRYHADKSEGQRLAVPVPYYDANNGGANYLVRNAGPSDQPGGWLRFEDATAAVGLDVRNSRFSFAAVWEDFDGDGDADLYVANDFGRNVFYENRLVPDGEARFREVADAVGLREAGFGMSAATGDFNRDGHPDIYAGNMFSAAGNRVTHQPQFRTGAPDAIKREFQRMAQGNGLFLGGAQGDAPRFTDASATSGAAMGRWSWGSVPADINNDGWEDLLVANGFVTGRQPDDL
ncbi:hypothetical protein BH23VER1_BH23VER1_17850 [soil metagenome]